MEEQVEVMHQQVLHMTVQLPLVIQQNQDILLQDGPLMVIQVQLNMEQVVVQLLRHGVMLQQK